MTDEKLFELHEKVKDAKVNGGYVIIDAADLADLLPAQPVAVEFKPAQPAVGDNHQPVELKPAAPVPAVDPAKPTVQ